MDFVAHRIYDDRITVATRNPETEAIDCIDVDRVDGRTRRQGGGARRDRRRRHEAAAPARQTNHRSVGVITPFRAQADALEEAVLAAFDADELAAIDLRVGTVHAFQGNERDIVVASLGIDGECNASTWRFAEDPHLFTVMVTGHASGS